MNFFLTHIYTYDTLFVSGLSVLLVFLLLGMLYFSCRNTVNPRLFAREGSFLSCITKERRKVMKMNLVSILWDEEAGVWVATCDTLGIVLESESYDELIKRVIAVAPEMAKANNIECSSLVFSTLNRQYVYN